ncbi:MAG: HPr(Ser) kinase/phosphatase [Gammaproteobacteria bacterium]|nr:HPr(Ser) kinase/phosphatase [Gammaproteobacteria bacterium]
MNHPLSIQTLYELHHKQLELEWICCQKNIVYITPDRDDKRDTPVVGYFSTIHPNQIQVIGDKELEYFNSLDKEAIGHVLNSMGSEHVPVFIISKKAVLPEIILEYAKEKNIPVISSGLSGKKLIEYLNYYLSQLISEQTVLHGVFMEVMGIGVLIAGPSGIGKSELALELLSRGHRLVADDAPKFTRTGPDVLHGTCPNLLHGFIEVRGLGVLNVRAMYGETSILQTKRLRLVIRMELFTEKSEQELNRLDTAEHYENIIDVEIPVVSIPVAPGRNMAVIVEAAVRNHVLRLSGYNATEDFINRQQQAINQDSE